MAGRVPIFHNWIWISSKSNALWEDTYAVGKANYDLIKAEKSKLTQLINQPFFRPYKERPQSCSLASLRTFIHVACCPSWQSVLLEFVLLLFSKLPCYICKSVWARLSNPLTPRPRTWKPVPRFWAPVTEQQPLLLGKHPSSSLCSPTCCF